MDPIYSAALASDTADPAALLSVALMLGGLVVVSLAALVEHYARRSNFITRAVDRWSK